MGVWRILDPLEIVYGGGYYPPPRLKAPFCHRLPTLSCFTHATPHPIFSQSEHVEASSSPASCTISMAENTASTGHTLLAYILNFQWIHQDSRFTTPPPDYGNLYDAETPTVCAASLSSSLSP